MHKFTGRLYRHYKNQDYLVINQCKHSESLEDLVYYKCCYENQSGAFWVRPTAMFFGEVEHEGRLRKRFSPVEFTISTEDKAEPHSLEQIKPMVLQTFPNFDYRGFVERISREKTVLLLRAFDGPTLAGFKLGYALDSDKFYSWLGAVAPHYRGVGLAGELMRLQHGWCGEQGYKTITTKTLNRWPEMLKLNLKHGYCIVATELSPKGETKLILSKSLF